MHVYWGGSPIQTEAAAPRDPNKVYVDRFADVAFVIDGTGSMQDEIDSVKDNLKKFIELLKDAKVKVRIRFAVYRDAEQPGQTTQTTEWLNAVEETTGQINETAITSATSFLESITASGGPKETLMDGYGEILFDTQKPFRDKAAKFVIALTDENYYVYPSETERTEKKVLEALKEQSIISSVVTKRNLFTEYGKFRTRSSSDDKKDGGILADIDGDYSILLKELAEQIELIIDDTQALKIGANMIVLKKWSDKEEYTIITDDGSGNKVESNPQKSCVFKNLEPDTIYGFKVKDTETNKVKEFEIRTEKATGAQMGKIPSIVYEGETYQIRPNENMKTMLATPDAKITWSSVSDCLEISDNVVGNGCEMKVNDCKYSEEKLIAATLTADIEYSVWQKNGTYKTKSARFKQKFNVKNDVDAMYITNFHGTTDNVYKNGILTLLTNEKVWLDVQFNQGDSGDVASKQKMKYFISDKYGNPNPMGKKIAKVDSKGQLSGVAPGNTYVTIASADSYNKYSRIYGYFATIPISCPAVSDVEFDMEEALQERPNVIKKESGEENTYIVKKGESLNLKEYISYNPSNVYNEDNMKCNWSSTNKTVGNVSSKGSITFKNEGYATIFMVPVGGCEVDSTSGKKIGSVQPCSITFKVVEDINK